MKVTPSRSEFCHLAKDYNIVPVTVDLAVDLDTPVSLFYKLVGDKPGFMLESAENNKTFGRYSFIGTDPFMTLTAFRDRIVIESDERFEQRTGAPLAALQDILNTFRFPDLTLLPPFSGGAVGYLSYDAVQTWERVRGSEITADFILGEFMLCNTILVMDHLTHTAKLMHLSRVPPGKEASLAYDEAVQSLTRLVKRLQATVQLSADADLTRQHEHTASIDELMSKQRFMENVRRAQQYIAAGDIFQVVLSCTFSRDAAEHPFTLYRRLRRVNPSPYMFYINFGSRKLVGASPELLVKLEKGHVFTCPIAGTRPRGKDPAEDEQLAAELLADTKERAEHAMLVDLGRNDLGRISIPGTVEVSRFMEVDNFSHVMHIVSEVTGRVEPRFKPTDVLAACFPAGTVSGAPKIRAMEIINELEQRHRGPYAGAVGYIDFRGNMDTCITIRTLVVENDKVTIQTGAGIVADSVPEKEYQEIRHKAQVLFHVLDGGD